MARQRRSFSCSTPVEATHLKRLYERKVYKSAGARAGHGSRREIESIIEAGRVSVDGEIAAAAIVVEITPVLKIRIDGHLISGERVGGTNLSRSGLYKPEGELCPQ